MLFLSFSADQAFSHTI